MTEITKKTVEAWLREVVYDVDDTSYVPSNFALEFVNFIKLVNGEEGEEHETPVLHYKMLDQIPGKKANICNLLFRGAAKTTVFGEYLFLYIAVYGGIPGFGRIDLAIYVSDSIDNGVKNMRKNLEFRWENSEFLKTYIPTIKFTDVRWEFNNIDGEKLIVKGYGAKTGVRGTKELGKRPQLAVLDDLLSDEDARSATVIASVEDTVYKAIDYALHPTKNKIIWNGTPFNARDPLYKAVESGAWHVNVFPVCETFPCEREDFKGAWPDRFDYDAVKQKYDKALKAGKIDTFNQEMMLRIMSNEDRLIPDEHILWYPRKTLLKNRQRYYFVITTDFATSASEAADNSVISVWAIGSGVRAFWVDGIVRRQTMEKNINDLFRLSKMYKPQLVGIEISGQQEGFIPWLNKEMVERNVFFQLASHNNSSKPGIRPTTNKMERFNVVVPWIKGNRVYFPEEMALDERIVEFIEELRLVSAAGFKSKRDDCLDTLSQLPLLTLWDPSDNPDDEDDEMGIGIDIWGNEVEDTGTRMGSYIV